MANGLRFKMEQLACSLAMVQALSSSLFSLDSSPAETRAQREDLHSSLSAPVRRAAAEVRASCLLRLTLGATYAPGACPPDSPPAALRLSSRHVPSVPTRSPWFTAAQHRKYVTGTFREACTQAVGPARAGSLCCRTGSRAARCEDPGRGDCWKQAGAPTCVGGAIRCQGRGHRREARHEL